MPQNTCVFVPPLVMALAEAPVTPARPFLQAAGFTIEANRLVPPTADHR